VPISQNHNGKDRKVHDTFVSLSSDQRPFWGHPGIPGPHSGTGLLAVADWWLGRARADEFDTEAAATPTKTIERAIMRMASFMMVTSFGLI
jgi:hypothetical protein